MIAITFLDNYDDYRYTKISVPVSLEVCPSDIKEYNQFIDLDCDEYHQTNCYIGAYKIDSIHIRRIGKRTQTSGEAPSWNITLVLNYVLKEKDVLILLDTLCEYLTFQCAKQQWIFQHNGLAGFSYCCINVKRQYAIEPDYYSDVDFNHYGGPVHMKSYSTLPTNLFHLPEEPEIKEDIQLRMEKGLVTALKSGDAISRYLLLYYLFEIIYASEDYQNLKQRYSGYDKANLLYYYLHDLQGVIEYKSFEKSILLTDHILREIIRVRNDLTHRANTSEISNMMYHHLLPILQEMVAHFHSP